MRANHAIGYVGVVVVLLLGAVGCTVIHETTPPPVYDPAPPAPVVQQDIRYETPPPDVYSEYERDLSPYGHWVRTEYGRCWAPYGVPPGWQPYTVGHWDDTNRGWCWASEGPEAEWGVITFHYGRWYVDRSYGWVWVPGDVWSPAWVSWREGAGYCGWYPLPPQVGDGVNVRVETVDRYCPPERYVYCDERYVNEPSVYRHVEHQDVTIINRTTNITNITYVDNRVENRGISVQHVEERSGKRVNRSNLAETDNATDARRLRQEGKPVVYSPSAVARASQESQPRLRQAMTVDHQAEDNKSKADHIAAQEQARQHTAEESALAQQRLAEQQDAARKHTADEKAQAAQRMTEKQDAARQAAAARASEEEQKKAQADAEAKAHQEEMQQHRDSIKQQQEEAKAQQQAVKQQRATEKEQAAQAEKDRAATEAEQKKAEREARQKADKAAKDAQHPQDSKGPPPQ
jgi:hypothetical protein